MSAYPALDPLACGHSPLSHAMSPPTLACLATARRDRIVREAAIESSRRGSGRFANIWDTPDGWQMPPPVFDEPVVWWDAIRPRPAGYWHTETNGVELYWRDL